MKTYIIAEAGVNHNGSLELAKKLVDVAKQAGADAVKFQTFKAENLVTKFAQQANYQVENLGEATSQFSMLKQLELSFEEFVELRNYCNNQQIDFLSTPFDYESVDFLFDDLNIPMAKIPSGELTNSPFIHYIAKKRKPIILSTGMATIKEIHEALSFIAFGLAKPNERVNEQKVRTYYRTEEAKSILKKFIKILHCTTEYPAPFETVNLKAMVEMKKEFQLPIGLSDHSKGISVPIAAAALGATIIEKHFTLDCSMEGPDHIASLEPRELSEMIQSIREVELALGTGKKDPTPVELQNRIPARKSLVAKKSIQAGELFTEENLTVKRPGNGISPKNYWNYLGKIAQKSYMEDQLIDE
ncbi:N-acetylneuraminate synthase [Fervidibacillus albus]|uniref:N-acetylneuraminate synthase n=1 Tax=Fervidibacillus albus TaxID=2980026 RepID=A0A9E8RW87_9BACI|nr:N-acetylneuraminate synthase [Fervidibacillus albus]WAA09798.1 N-acetylneuraminate synthase [Fervidibacillus albus]